MFGISRTVPECVQTLFWDVKREEVDVQRHCEFIIRRVLDFGDVAALNWLRQTYADKTIKEVVNSGRGLAGKTLAFWSLYYSLGRGERDV